MHWLPFLLTRTQLNWRHHHLVNRYEIVCRKWPQVCMLHLSSYMTYLLVCNNSSTMGVTCEARTAYPSGAPEFTPSFCGVRVDGSSGFRVMSCRLWLVLLPLCLSFFLFSFGRCIVSPSSIQWLVVGRWFSPDTPVVSMNKTDSHHITEILLKVALNTITLTAFSHLRLPITPSSKLFLLNLVYFAMFCRSLFFLSSIFLWALPCLSFDLHLLFTSFIIIFKRYKAKLPD